MSIKVNQSVIVYGPYGSGKTRNAESIADMLGLSTIIECESPLMAVRVFNAEPQGILYIFGPKLPQYACGCRMLHIEDALTLLALRK